MVNSRRARSNLKKVKSVLFSISLCACTIIVSVFYGLKDFGETTYVTFDNYTVRVSIHPYPFHAECLTLRSDWPSTYTSLCRPGSREYDRQLGRPWLFANAESQWDRRSIQFYLS